MERSNHLLEAEDLSVVPSSKKNFFVRHIGIVLGIISSCIFSIHSVLVKVLAFHPVQIALSRTYLQYMVLLPFLLRPKTIGDIVGPRKARIYMWIQGLMGTTSSILFYLSVKHLSVGNAVTLTFLDVVLVPIIGRIFFKEALTIVDGIFALVSFCGVVLIAKPPFIFHHLSTGESENAIGILYGILSVIFASLYYLSIRKIGKQVKFSIIVFYYSFIGAIMYTILLPIVGDFRYPCLLETIFLVLIMATGLLGTIALVLALQRERAGTVSILLTLQIIVVYLIQVIILNDIPSTLSLVGSGLIFSISICIGLRKLIKEKRRK